jgi:hypothetical protein
MALALVGAGESLADRLVDLPHEDPERTATRMMSAIWLGAERQLHGESWRSAPSGSRSTSHRGGARSRP